MLHSFNSPFNRHLPQLAVGAILSLSALACDTVEDGQVVEHDEESLVGGTTTNARPEVGRFRGCTATLFAERYVITAAHCLNYPNYGDTAVRSSDAFSGVGINGSAFSYGVDRIHSFATSRYEMTLGAMTTDIAIIRLTSAVPETVAVPARLSPVPPTGTARSTIFGYGCTTRSPQSGGGNKQALSFNFGTATQALCPGDSGGPVVFGNANERGAIWGINSDYQGTGTFNTWNDMFADVPNYKRHIEALIRDWEGTQHEVGIDRPGMDYRNFNLASANPELCKSECQRDTTCKAWTYVRPGFQGPSARCWLKFGVPDWVPNAACTSGVQIGAEAGTDRPGTDYRSFDLPAARPELCRAQCGEESVCRAYTYVSPGIQGPNARCWLKNGVPNSSSHWQMESGVRRGSEPGVDRPGHDYRNFNLSSADPALCERACATDGICKAYSYVAPGVQGPSARCWLKNAVPAPVASVWITSGVRRGLEINTDRPGGDYRSFDLTSSSPETCQATCDAEAACHAFTYVPPGVQGTRARCWLKASIPGAVRNTNMFSGLKSAAFF